MKHYQLVVDRLDHVHVYVRDRAAATEWYREMFGLEKTCDYTERGDPHGPVVLTAGDGVTHLALFERALSSNGGAANRSTIAFSVGGDAFLAFAAHASAGDPVDHGTSYSLYLRDPDGNPYEVTTYDYELVARSRSGV